MTLRFIRDQFHDEYDPTIEDSYCKHIEVDGVDYTLDIIDTAGQDEYRGHWNDQFLRREYVPIVVAANKSDLNEEREVASEIGKEFAQLSNAFYIETSAKTGINIHEMVHELVREIVRTRQMDVHVDMYNENERIDDDNDNNNNNNINGGVPVTTMMYVKSPTPPAPMGLIYEDDVDGKEEGCCCTIM
ncbi:Ras GTPase [Mortierella sp. AD094]|nr:Ras GTPase [Mortierella sp. AD094]